ncbi:MAG: type IX secretion system membrane protein PorP/SprF [Cytophagales bacterium]|nr:MAG: type IX secretion system membrane protein PorP/SprF [Cytophagales bacterium]
MKKSSLHFYRLVRLQIIILLSIAYFSPIILPRLCAQDAVFSQFYASGLYLNPALASLQPHLVLNTNYRVQWANINPHTTGQISLIYPFLNKNNPLHYHWGGMGASVFQDNTSNQNQIKNTGANASFAYNINLGDLKTNLLCMGIQAGFIQQQLNTTNLIWGTQYTQGTNTIDANAELPNIVTQKIYPTFAGGLFWYFANSNKQEDNSFKMYAGIAGYHLNTPNKSMLSNSNDQLAMHLKAHGGISLPLSPKLSFSPNFIFAYQQPFRQFNTGAYFSYLINESSTGIFARTELILGSWYRWGDALIVNTGISTNFFSLGFSYDMNRSSLQQYANTTGAYEISLGIKIPRGVQLKHYATPRI